MSYYALTTADSLTHNDRVIREGDSFPYLVDRVDDDANTVIVTYSNGDEVTYPKRQPVIIVDQD